MKRMTLYWGCFALAAASAAPAAAESLLLDEITVRGQQESTLEENLTIREVRESPAKDVGEALKQVEGISTVRKGAIANDVVLRGFQKDNINVLVDGVRIQCACPSRMDPPAFHYDFAEVDHIRVVKGPYDVTNPGSLGGLVDVQTREAQQGFGSDLSLTYGSYNAVNGSATVSYGADAYDALVGYAYKRSDVPESGNGRLITDIYSSTSSNRYRSGDVDSKAYEINTGWTKVGFRPTSNSRTELSYSYQDADHVLYPYLKMDGLFDRTHRLNWYYRIDNVTPVLQQVKLQAYWDNVSHVMDDSLRVSSLPTAVVTKDYSMRTDAETQVGGVKLGGVFSAGPGSLKAGVDYYNRNWNALNTRASYTAMQHYAHLNMIPDVSTDNLGMYGEYSLPLNGGFRLTAGMRGDLAWIEANRNNNATAVDSDTNFADVSGNLQLSYTPAEGVELFAGVGRGVRIPDGEELYIDVPAMAPMVTWRGNPHLEKTINHQVDIGAKYSSDRLYLNGSLFYSDLKDYVNFYAASSTLKSYQNIDAAMWGGELGGQVSLPLDLFVKASLSYTRGENKDSNRPLSEIPPLRGTMALRYDNAAFFCEVAENMAMRQNKVDRSLNEEETPGWATTDLKAGVNYQSWSVYGGVNNLFDKQYYSHLSYLRDPFASGVGVRVPENGRNLYITLAYRF